MSLLVFNKNYCSTRTPDRIIDMILRLYAIDSQTRNMSGDPTQNVFGGKEFCTVNLTIKITRKRETLLQF